MQKINDALKNSGKKGLEIWVIKTIKPRESALTSMFSGQPKPEVQHEVFAVAPRHHGVFYFEDLYLVLKTNLDTKQRDLHFWFGSSYKETPPPWVDHFETLELDWNANQHYEFQGQECELFESYFDNIQPALRYKRGSHPDPSADRAKGVTRFYKLEFRETGHYGVREIPFNIELMTKEECFILDTDYNTRTYVSDRTALHEKNKSVVVAHNIRDLDHEGNGDIEVVDLTTFSNEADKEAYVRASNLLAEEIPPRSVDFDQPDQDPKDAQLSMITFIFGDDADLGYPPRFRIAPKPRKSVADVKNLSFCGRIKKSITDSFRKVFRNGKEEDTETYLPSLEEKFFKTTAIQPLKREMLDSKKCYLLEGLKGKGIFLWVGKSSDTALQKELLECLRNELRKSESDNEEHVNKDFVSEDMGRDVYEKKEEKKEEKKQEADDLTPRWTHIQKVIDGSEPVKFKRYFQDWE